MQKLFLILIIVAIPALYAVYVMQRAVPSETLREAAAPRVEMPLIRIGHVPLLVEVADTSEERTRGLGGRTALAPTSGMLFIFDRAGHHGIWMRDVSFPIDVLWVGEDLKVVDILPNLSPETFPRSFEPKAPARFVIETNAHYAESFGIAIGDAVTIPHTLIPTDIR